MIQQLILTVHIIIAFTIIGLVLMQHGKGAEAGAAFGGSASQTVFGSHGSGSFLSKLTTILAVLFAATSISLTMFVKQSHQGSSVLEQLEQQGIISKDSELPKAPE